MLNPIETSQLPEIETSTALSDAGTFAFTLDIGATTEQSHQNSETA